MMRSGLTLISIALLLFPTGALCREKQIRDTLRYPDSFLDTVVVAQQKDINDYSLLGVNYGVTFCGMYFNPTKHGSLYSIAPNFISIMYTHYEKMFQYIPYFGFQIGIQTGNEGFEFKKKENGNYMANVDFATYCRIRTVEIPAMAQIHVDASIFKFMVNVGGYAGYRLSIQRSGTRSFNQEYAYRFRDYERRMDYGLMGGAGLALVFDPIEIHFNGLVRWGWSSLYNPDYYSHYYHRYAYPLDVSVTAGIHFQLTKRKGKTTKALKEEAYYKVYGTIENPSGKSRE